MFKKLIPAWLSITTVISHSHNSRQCGHSMIPSAEEMGIEIKTHNIDYGLNNIDPLRRRMGVTGEGQSSDAGLGDIDTLDYGTNTGLTCDQQTNKTPMRIYVDYHVFEFQERQKFHADGLLSSLGFSQSECDSHVKEVVNKAKEIVSPVINYIQDHFSIYPGPVHQSLPIEFDWIPSLKAWKHDQDQANGDHSESYKWSFLDHLKFSLWAATHHHTEGEFDLVLYILNDDHYPCGPNTGSYVNVPNNKQSLNINILFYFTTNYKTPNTI